jgi:hypothetical protein
MRSPHLDLHLWPLHLIHVFDQPLHRRHQPAALVVLNGSHRVDGPVALQPLHVQFLAEVLHVHGGHVSLVGDHKQHGLLHVGVGEDAVELAGGQLDALAIRTVHHVD